MNNNIKFNMKKSINKDVVNGFNQHYRYLDILRVIAMLAVVIIHIISGNLEEYFFSKRWHLFNIINTALIFAVPVFFMISGALILSKEKAYDIKYVLKNRVCKVLIPLITWTVINNIILCWNEIISGDISWIISNIKYVIKYPIVIHLWFLYALIPMYLLSPVIKVIIDNANEKIVKYIIILWIATGPVFNTLTPLLKIFDKDITIMNSTLNLNFINGFLGYFILGYYLHKLDCTFIEKKIGRAKLVICTFLTFLIITVGTIFLQRYNANYFDGLQVYNGVFCMIYSVLIFLTCKVIFRNSDETNDETKGKYDKLKNILLLIKEYTVMFFKKSSFGIYLMHNVVILFYMSFFPYLTMRDKVSYIILVLITSGIITNIVLRIPILSYILFGEKTNKIEH